MCLDNGHEATKVIWLRLDQWGEFPMTWYVSRRSVHQNPYQFSSCKKTSGPPHKISFHDLMMCAACEVEPPIISKKNPLLVSMTRVCVLNDTVVRRQEWSPLLSKLCAKWHSFKRISEAPFMTRYCVLQWQRQLSYDDCTVCRRGVEPPRPVPMTRYAC